MSRKLAVCFCFFFLSACSQFNEPLIEDEMVKLTVTCEGGETIEIGEQKVIDKVIQEINRSRREGTQEMEFDFEHSAALETSDGKTRSFNLFSGGKAVMPGYYIHSDIHDFCEETS